jgi:hypothetical protein
MYKIRVEADLSFCGQEVSEAINQEILLIILDAFLRIPLNWSNLIQETSEADF